MIRFSTQRDRAAAALLIPLLVLLAGCRDGEARPEVHPVEGTLTVNGQPAEGALLSFHPVDGQNFDARGSRPWATVQADGRFVVSTYGEADGAPAGEYAVSVVWLDNPDSASPVDRLGGALANPQQSEWRVQISEGENVLAPYAIENVRLRRSRSTDGAGDAVEPTG